MFFELSEINRRVKTAPAEFVSECDNAYEQKIALAAEKILENLGTSPIVLLAGPSGSGKTTTAKKIEQALMQRGVKSHSVSMDDYFKTLNPATAPRTAKGDIDYESPLLLDMELLNEHFSMLSRGETVNIPHFIFSRQKRSANLVRPLTLGKDEIAIFEGIHALNDIITTTHPEAMKVYISASSDIRRGSETVFARTWLRLCRRIVRDDNFRGADAAFTLALWGDVLRGEKLYIDPFKHKADIMFDTSLPYEVPLVKSHVLPLLHAVAEDNPQRDEVEQIIGALELFAELDSSLVQGDSLMREFIGGSVFSY